MPTDFGSNNNRLPQDIANLSDEAIWDLLSVYADGEATPEQAEMVEALLCSDPRYAQDLQFMRRTSESVQMFTELEPPVALRETIFAATTRRQTVASRLVTFWGDLRQSFAPRVRYATVGGLAAAALVAVIFWPHAQIPNGNALNQPKIKDGKISKTALNNHSETYVPAPIKDTEVGPKIANILPTFPPQINIPSETSSKTPKLEFAKYVPQGPKPSDFYPAPKPGQKNNSPKIILTNEGNNPEQNAVVAIKPNMDAENRHATPNRVKLPDPISTQDEALATIGTENPKTSPGPDPGPPPPGPGPTRPEPKVTVVRLPPEAYQFLSNAQMKRQLDAKSLGYDRDTVKSIQRKELTVSLIKGSL